jgi:AcrR family transcriptional regulator
VATTGTASEAHRTGSPGTTSPLDVGDGPERLLAGAPRPLLSTTAEERLGARHREVLDGLEAMVRDEGLSGFTIGELAARLTCSRRTLYELLLLVLDRFMHRIGRQAIAAIDPGAPTTEQLRQYVMANTDYAFRSAAYDDLTDTPGVHRLLDRHFRFAVSIIERLVTHGIERGEIRQVNASVVAAVLLSGTVHLAQPDVIDDVGCDLATAIDDMLDVVLRGLEA